MSSSRGCKGKKQYATKKEAENAMYTIKKTKGISLYGVHLYRCGDHWHYGRYRKKRGLF